jgi:hypothetical protein
VANFEVFPRHNRRAAATPTVTLTRRRRLSLNAAAFAALGAPEAVQLMWDRDRGVVGLRTASPADGDAYQVNTTNLIISASAFLDWVGLETPDPLALRWDAFLENGVLCIRVRDTPTPVASNRAMRTAG